MIRAEALRHPPPAARRASRSASARTSGGGSCSARTVTGADYGEARAAGAGLAPLASSSAFERGRPDPHAVDRDDRAARPTSEMIETTRRLVRLTYAWSLAGLPALSASPAASRTAGLPVGLQLAAARFGEATLLRAGAAYQRDTDWHLREPALVKATEIPKEERDMTSSTRTSPARGASTSATAGARRRSSGRTTRRRSSASASTTRRAPSTRRRPATTGTKASPRSPTSCDAQYRDLVRGVGLRVRQPGRRLAAAPPLRRVRGQDDVLLRRAVALERNPEVGQWIQESGPRAVQPRLALGGALAARPRRGAAAHPVGDRVVPADDAVSGPLGWYCRYGPSVNTRELLVEEGGFVYDSDAYNDDLPVLHRGQGQAPPRRPLQPDLQRRPLRPAAGLRRAVGLLRRLPPRPRRAAPRRAGRLPEDDVDRAPPALGRPGGPHVGAARVHRVRARAGRRLVRAADRHRQLVARAPRGVRALMATRG